MSIPGLFSTQITQLPGSSFHVFVGGTDIAHDATTGAGIRAGSLQLGTGLDAAVGTFSGEVGDPGLLYGLPARSPVVAVDDSVPAILFDGFLTSRQTQPAFGQQGRQSVLSATGSASMLESSLVIPAIAFPAGMSDRAIVQSIVGNYCVGGMGTGVAVQSTNASMPAMSFGSQTVRSAIEQIALAANQDGQGERHYYVDANRQLHYFLTEANPAPKNINPATSGTAVASEDLTITYDDSSIRTAVFIRGSTAAGTGWVSWGAGVAAYGWIPDQLDVSDSDTVAKMLAYGTAYLVPRSQPVIRGSFAVDSVTGWAAGQTVQITNAAMGLSATPFLIYAVNRAWTSGAYSRYTVSFGAKPPSVGHA